MLLDVDLFYCVRCIFTFVVFFCLYSGHFTRAGYTFFPWADNVVTKPPETALVLAVFFLPYPSILHFLFPSLSLSPFLFLRFWRHQKVLEEYDLLA